MPDTLANPAERQEEGGVQEHLWVPTALWGLGEGRPGLPEPPGPWMGPLTAWPPAVLPGERVPVGTDAGSRGQPTGAQSWLGRRALGGGPGGGGLAALPDGPSVQVVGARGPLEGPQCPGEGGRLCASSLPVRGVEGFRVMVPDYSASVVYLRLGRAGRTTRTLLLISESRGRSRAGPAGRPPPEPLWAPPLPADTARHPPAAAVL